MSGAREDHPDSLPDQVAAALVELLALVEAGDDVDVDRFCAERSEIAEDLRDAYGLWKQVAGALDPSAHSTLSQSVGALRRRSLEILARLGDDGESSRYQDVWESVFERLADKPPLSHRYAVQEEIDAGGMGSVHRVWDRDLRRRLALKRIRLDKSPDGTAAYQRALGRFLDEAQITAQLDHPGVVPVHDLGLDSDGRPYFTMKLVAGEHLGAVFEKVRVGADGWTRPRALGILLRVCEAMAFAHSKHVLHRDLKPANIMVGRFGETYVMDWGLARVFKEGGSVDLAPESDAPPSDSRVRPERDFLPSDAPDSILYTKNAALGTPPYMPPEAALEQPELVGFHSDVYSAGAMLYELLTGQMPYVSPNEFKEAVEIWKEVCSRPPVPIERLAPDAPAELVAICEKAMARDIADRYSTMEDLSHDLRAYLEGRVVAVHRTGAVVEFKKWVLRNKAVAALVGSVALVVVAGSLLFAWSEQRRAVEIRKSTAGRVAAQLVAEAEAGLGPIHPGRLQARLRWRAAARDVLAIGEPLREDLEALRAQALPYTPERRAADREQHAARGELRFIDKLLADWKPAPDKLRRALGDQSVPAAERERVGQELQIHDWHVARRDQLQQNVDTSRTWQFEQADIQLRHDALEASVHQFDRLNELLVQIDEDMRRSERLEAETVSEWAAKWKRARDAIAASPVYGGLRMTEQIGLVPLRENAAGLWEFWHVLSGASPTRDADGRLVVKPETGIVLVLLPGGRFWMGSSAEEGEPNYDPEHRSNEGPARQVELAPFFISKYELTQAQWMRATGANPSTRFAGASYDGVGRVLGNHPVETVSWYESRAVLERYGLTLPTEAQHEYAQRAGVGTPYWWGVDSDVEKDIVYFRDGKTAHWRVDRGPANAFELHQMAGNVREFCADWYSSKLSEVEIAPDTGEMLAVERKQKAYRGGGFSSFRNNSRSSRRLPLLPNDRKDSIGVRAARELDIPGSGDVVASPSGR